MPDHAVDWWFAVTAYVCPVCDAGPGQPCRTYSGNRKSEPHADRARLASANGWRDPDAEPDPADVQEPPC